MGDSEDQQRLSAALSGLVVKPSVDPAWSWPSALRVIDCILSLNRSYDSFVVKRRNQFEREHPHVCSITELQDMIAAYPSPHQFMVSNLNYNHEERANTLYAVVKWMATISGRGSAEEQLSNIQHWAKNAQPQEYSGLGIRGFGLAAFQYLRMLFGANTTKPDIHICRFVECCVGHRVSPIQALRLLEGAASSSGFSLLDLDSTIWKTSARKSTTRCSASSN